VGLLVAVFSQFSRNETEKSRNDSFDEKSREAQRRIRATFARK